MHSFTHHLAQVDPKLAYLSFVEAVFCLCGEGLREGEREGDREGER